MTKTYAVLLAPEFQLQAVLRHSPQPAEHPGALLEVQGTKHLISELNAAATMHGVERGLTPTQALARCPALQLVYANDRHSCAAGEIMLQTAEAISPFLEATQPGVVTLELPAEKEICAEHLRIKLVAPLAALGLRVSVGVAGTPDLARLAARFAQPVRIVTEPASFLAPLPIEALQPDEEMATVLASWGIRTIGQFSALGRTQVGARLGPAAIRLAEQAAGGSPRPLCLVKPQEFFAEQADLEHSVETLAPLLFLLQQFLEKIEARLGQAHFVADRLRLVLRFEQGEPYRHVFTLPHPTRDNKILFRVLHTHLENFTSPSLVNGLELAAKPVRPTAEQFGLLERGLRDPYRFVETLARLEALLGPGCVGAPRREPSHHPDAFHLRVYDPQPAPPSAPEELLLGLPWLRFHPPVAARVTLEDVRRPAYLQSSKGIGPIRQAWGPWLAEGSWWEPRHWAREEWDIALEDAIYRLVHNGQDWFLDGVYA